MRPRGAAARDDGLEKSASPTLRCDGRIVCYDDEHGMPVLTFIRFVQIGQLIVDVRNESRTITREQSRAILNPTAPPTGAECVASNPDHPLDRTPCRPPGRERQWPQVAPDLTIAHEPEAASSPLHIRRPEIVTAQPSVTPSATLPSIADTG